MLALIQKYPKLDKRRHQHATPLLRPLCHLLRNSPLGEKFQGRVDSRTESSPLQRPKADFGLHDVGGDRSAYLVVVQSAVAVAVSLDNFRKALSIGL